MAVDFKGFRRSVNTLDCVYTDVDRRYFNDNTGPEPDYAEIDVQPGYQRLCGQRALDYVRYRHGDSDFVRAARQQDFLRDAKDQVGTSELFDKSTELIEIFGSSTQTDPGLQENGRCSGCSSRRGSPRASPSAQIPFPGDIAGGRDEGGLGAYVTATPTRSRRPRRFLAATRHEGALGARRSSRTARSGPAGQADHASRTSGSSTPSGEGGGRRRPARARATVDFPIYFPQGADPGSRWAAPTARAARLRDPRPRRTSGTTPTDSSSPTTTLGATTTGSRGRPGRRRRSSPGRREAPDARSRLPLVLRWKEAAHRRLADPVGHYWVWNTLGLALTNTQMLGIARSLTRSAPDPPPHRMAVNERQVLRAWPRPVQAFALAASSSSSRRGRGRHRGAAGGQDVEDIFDEGDDAASPASRRERPRQRRRRRAADDPRTRLRPPLRRHQGEEPDPLGHDHPAAPGPVQGRHGGDVDPARPAVHDPRRRHRQDQRRLRLGGPKLTVRTVRQLLGVPDPHVVNINFGGFRRAVDRLGCVYADIDRKYFNDNSPPAGGPHYAVIDIEAGLPEALRQGRAGVRALPPLRHRPRPRRAPAGLPAPGQGPDRRLADLLATARS